MGSFRSRTLAIVTILGLRDYVENLGIPFESNPLGMRFQAMEIL
jgi:hypothetical protein